MKKIAIVNDEHDFAEMVAMLLRDEGFEARSCSDGATALDLIRDWQPDLVILDIRMKGLNGWQILDRIEADPLLRGRRVLVTSGAVEEVAEASRRLRGSGHDFMALPFDLDEFVGKVREMLG